MSDFSKAFDSVFLGKEVFRRSRPSIIFFCINNEVFFKFPNGNRLAWIFNKADFEALDWVIPV